MTSSDPTAQYAAQQQVIDAVVASHGGRPVPIVVDALRAGFRAHGLACPPPTWLSAVAAEVSLGHVYVVSPTVTPFPLTQEVS